MRTIDIPAAATNTFLTAPLPFRQADQIMLAMSDSTGLTAGGISRLIPVNPAPVGSPACNITPPAADFFFFTDRPLEQCKDFTIGAAESAILPFMTFGFEPEGESFSVQGGTNSRVATWKANYTVGSQLIFCVRDGQVRNGGCSQVNVVGPSDDDSCIASAKKKTNVGAIAGGAVGGVVGLGIIGFLIWFFLKKKRSDSQSEGKAKIDLDYDPTVNGPASPVHGHLLPNAFTNPGGPGLPPSPHGGIPPSPQGAPSIYTSQTSSNGVQPYGYVQPGAPQAFSQSGQSSSSQGGGSQFYTTNGDQSHYPPSLTAHISKSAQQQQPQVLRPVVQHQDLADTMPIQDNVPEELPPQYSENRAPIPGLPASQGEGGSSSSTPQAQARALRDRKGA